MKKVVLKLIKLAILQPSYIPWVGYFEQIMHVDKFVFYDDVQYTKNDWRNRNRIKVKDGLQWLTVPIKHTSSHMLLSQVMIDNSQNWRVKHLKSLIQYYSRSKYFDEVYALLENNLLKELNSLNQLNINIIQDITHYLEIGTEFFRSSELQIKGERNERLINMCKYFGAKSYYTGAAAKEYIDESRFISERIELSYQKYEPKVYQQLHGEFTPFLSIIDLIFNHGKNSIEIIKGK